MQTVSAAYFKNVFDGCIANGADAAALNAMVSGGKQAFDNPLRRFPRGDLITTLNTAVSLTGDQGLGVKVGAALRPNSLLDIGYALTVCDNLKEAAETNSLYQPLIQQVGQTRFELTDEAAKMVWTPLYESVELFRYFVEMIFAGYAVIGRWLLFSETDTVTRVQFRHSQPANNDAARAMFGDVIEYGADIDQLSFRPELALIPLQSRNPEMKQILLTRLDKQLASLGQPQSLTAQAVHLIHTLLPQGRPTLKDLAGKLGMSERSLRRKLSEEDVSFSELLETARKEACDIYMRQGTRSFAQIAQALGYSDQSAFSRAFKTWHGKTPNAYKMAEGSAE